MKLTILMLAFGILSCYASESYSQTARLTLNMENSSIGNILKAIEDQSEFRFFYSGAMDTETKASVSVNNKNLMEVLDELFRDMSIRYEIYGRQIALMTYNETALPEGVKQTGMVTGVITDMNGEPLPGATVMVKGTNMGVISNADGTYSISNVPSNATLVFSFVGMRTQEIVVGNRKSIDVRMELEMIGIEEVIAIGYGTVRKSDLTGSVASVSSEDLIKFPASNVSEMLRGQAAGVQVTLSSARPGGGSNIMIRGQRSLSGGNNPLYVVDGIIVSGINDINPNDIQNIEILKDASSQAIYGARAYNGVVLVTTKRGKNEKLSVELNSYFASQSYHRNFELYSPEEWVELRRQAKRSEGAAWEDDATVFNDDIMYQAYLNNTPINWTDLMLSKGVFQQKTDLSISGGNDKLRAAGSLGYYGQNGIVKSSGFKRGNMRLNVDFSPSENFSFGTNLSYVRSLTQREDGSYNYYLTRPPFGQAFDEEGNLTKYINSRGDDNPIWRNNESLDESINNHVVIGTFAEIKLLRGLSYRLNASTRFNNTESGSSKTKDYPLGVGEQTLSYSYTTAYVVDNIINYSLPFESSNHKLNVTAIQTSDENRYKYLYVLGKNPPVDYFAWNNIGDSEIQNVTRSLNRHRISSFAGRIHYSLLDKYLLTFSIRRDGSSVFGGENKWANFPSAAVAWKLHQEKFMKEKAWISNLKIRVSYGIVGNEAIPNYRTLGLTDSYNMLFGNVFQVGYLPQSDLRNPALKWETSATANLGVDFGFFNNRFSGTIESFRTRTYDLLVSRSIPQITGYTSMWDNLGETKSWGYEGSIQSILISKSDFSWKVGMNASIIRNKLVKIDDRFDDNGNPVNDISNNWFIGEPLNVYYDYVFDGIWQTGEETEIMPTTIWGTLKPGDIKLKDVNGDGIVDTDDRLVMKEDSDWFGTFYTNIQWKGIDFLAEFYTVQGVLKRNPYLYDWNSGGSLSGNTNGIKVNYWTPENPSQVAPRPYFSNTVANFSTSAYEDASYFRLRTLTLGYTLPEKLFRNNAIKNLRVYFTGSNLFTLTDFRSYSPEILPGGYPEPKTILFGLNTSF